MARLNEPPPPIESIDALKRRFIRQNREIARVNSTQSLRIRNLEAEISRLLAENIAIREQAINSAQEAERLRSSQRIFRDVSKLKEQLELRLSEVGTLVTELGALPDRAKRRSSQQQRRKSGLVELAKSPDLKDWKNRQTICGVVAGERQLQEGRLPVIVEGKHYPRKTLESLEISRLLDDETGASDSPELGPPPVAHFDVAEPINFTAPPPAGGEICRDGNNLQHVEDDLKALPEKLERRRKRRASALLEDMSTLIGSTADESNPAEQRMSLKSGAKRKLDVREDGYKEESGLSELDDFAFQRRAVASETPQARLKGSRFTKSGTNSEAGRPAEKEAITRLESVNRKVLAPKSTNSPSKSRRTATSDKTIPAQDDMVTRARPEEQVGRKKSKAIAMNSSTDVRNAAVEDIHISPNPEGTDLPPRTPASLELLSPASTEPSARQTEIALTTSVEDVLGGTDGRASRRARGAVSYAEPSLRAKMRRPTKELVPAVGDYTNSLKAQQRESSGRAESQEREPSQDLAVIKTRTVTIKREKPGDEVIDWKGISETREEPASPLVNRMAKFSPKEPAMEADLHSEELPDANADSRQLEAGLESLSIFDGPASPPHESPNTIAVPSQKTSRRHSSNPASLRRVGQEFAKPTTSSERAQAKNNPSGMSDRPPRPNSAASLRRENLGREDKMDLKRSVSVATLKSSVGTNVAPGSGVPGAAASAGRTERAAARRRSTMI